MLFKKIEEIVKILRNYYRTFQKPSVTEISHKYKDPFFVLISCILSLRTKDKTTVEASRRLFKLAGNPLGFSKVSLGNIQKAIYPVGFYRVKAKNIKEISKQLLIRFKGNVPSDIDALLSLKGVGRKTANLVLTLGFNKLGICVDTYVHRISNRLGIVNTSKPFDTEMELRKILPKKFWIEYNDLLVTFGQNICKPISPLCNNCKIYKLCPKIGVQIHR
ncbi:MAG: endonuclease III [Candidatus Omnitrophota bacterium]